MAFPVTTAIVLFTLLNTATASPLTKRDAGYAIPEGAIILLILFGAGLLVCMGYAIHKTFGFRRNPNEFRHMSAEQQEYMAEVRVRNMQGLMAEGAKKLEAGWCEDA
ncbi:hypothetical protein J4E90_003822 [Alternaria incomplexa]|uniref:uncharacterized protein n=1 Tax=Alternaria incomplexa TaxID=1187928 RepID=UPI00221F115A|nr:uncharacterized protein J4E90_003822 [Alternaria incomplexa]KAI4917315.1 hypothetical protein J4E90_003822 [Alternaria incomplexa]